MTDRKLKVGIIGSLFAADIHAASFQIMPEEAEVIAVASPGSIGLASFARKLAAIFRYLRRPRR